MSLSCHIQKSTRGTKNGVNQPPHVLYNSATEFFLEKSGPMRFSREPPSGGHHWGYKGPEHGGKEKHIFEATNQPYLGQGYTCISIDMYAFTQKKGLEYLESLGNALFWRKTPS